MVKKGTTPLLPAPTAPPLKLWEQEGYSLPLREKQIAILLMHGYTRGHIALKLGISFYTVRNRINIMMTKYEAVNVCNLIYKLMDRGLLFVDDPFPTRGTRSREIK